MGIGSLAKLGISKGMSLGRELFGFLLRSDLNVAKIAEWAGITMDTLKDAPPEALSAILERAARSGAIDPREANNINIQLAKDAQEAMPAMPTLKAQDAANKLSKQFGVNFDVSNHPTAYGNSTYVSGRISGPGRTNVRVGFRLSDHETGDIRKATDDFLTIIDDGNVSAESLVAEVQSQIERALPKMQKISDDREAKTIAQSDALSRWSELSGDERGEIAVKFNETRPTRFNNVPWKNLTKQQKADFAVDGPLAKEAQEASPDNVASFSDAKNDQMVSKIKGAIQNMPYTMNLPYEIGQKLNSEGKLPLPIGTNLLPLGGKGYPDEVHKIIGYKGDIYNPALYGYEVQAPNGDIFFQAISDPASGLRQQRADKVGSFTAALGPEGLTGMRFVPPSRPVRQGVEGPQISEAEQKVIDQEYNDLFGDFE
jgi:hypothetical protein